MVNCNQIMTLLSLANVRSILHMLRPEKSVKDSRCCSKSLAERLLTIDLTGPMEVGAIDRWRKPNPINAMVSRTRDSSRRELEITVGAASGLVKLSKGGRTICRHLHFNPINTEPT
mgnify:CR=1 FL=1